MLINILEKRFPDNKYNYPWFNVRCIFCQSPDSNTRPLGINIKFKFIYCFRCGISHKLSYLFKTINEDVDEDLLKSEDDNKKTVSKKYDVIFPEEYEHISTILDKKHGSYEDAVCYAKNRIGLNLASRLNVGFCSIGKYANRIVIPIFSEDDTVKFFSARSIYPYIEPKVLNSAVGKSDTLFNIDLASRYSEVYLTEGIFGALTLFPYSVAALGVNVTDSQIMKLIQCDFKIINILLDGGTRKLAFKLADRINSLTSRIRLRVIELKDKTQPDDYSFDEIMAIKNSTPFFTKDYMFL